jgi:hypothetical protein
MNSLMQYVRTGDVVAIEKYCMHELREEAAYRMADMGLGAYDEKNYITYWMASYRDHDVAHEMIQLFDKAVGHDQTVWHVFKVPTYIAAKVRRNQKILQFLPPVKQVDAVYDTDLV